jgi:hypothetical protein
VPTIATEIENAQPGQGQITLTWRFQPDDFEQVEVVVDPDHYETWLPQGTTDENTSANQIGIAAKLQTRDGRVPQQKAAKFRFELLQVSREPGTAMNFPAEPAGNPRPDLQFEETYNPAPAVVTDPKDRQKAEYSPVDGLNAGIVVSSFDWGAWGTIKVTAVLESGEEIVGYLRNRRDCERIPLPKRHDGSRIGDHWKRTAQVVGKSDYEDDEPNPVGDGHLGDGFTLYEEYRGFYENGEHIFGNPQRRTCSSATRSVMRPWPESGCSRDSPA